jgi:probable phosphoglycerate mutase
VAERLATLRIAAVITSPIQRARETAQAIVERTRAPLHVDDAFTEIEFGRWTGCTFGDLGKGADADAWRRFNTFRSGTRAGGSELMLDAQVRAVAGLLGLRESYEGRDVVVVSHADVIKAAVAYFIGVPIDLTLRLEVDTASISTLALDGDGVRLLRLNDTGIGTR